MTLEFVGGPKGGTIGGTLTVIASMGVATFGGLAVSEPGVGYVLRASGGPLGSATTASFVATAVGTTVGGTVFLDLNASGTIAARDPGMAGRVVFVDLHGDGILEADDPRAVTDASGRFSIAGLAPGQYTLRVKAYPNDDPTGADGGRVALDLASGQVATVANFGLQPGSTIVPRTPTPVPFAGASTTQEAVIASLYRLFLGRQGETAGIANWTEKFREGETYAQVAEQFLTSPEYQTHLIRPDYETFLGRAPEPAGLANWMAAFRAGWNEAQITEAFITSPEYRSEHADDADDVRSLYANLFGRDATDPEVSTWVGRMDSGMSRGAAGAKVVESTEAHLRGIEGDYTAFLAREGEADGIAHWLDLVQRRTLTLADVESGFVETPEFIGRASGGA